MSINRILLTSLPLLAAVGSFHPTLSFENEANGLMFFKPIPESAYSELTSDPAVLNESTWLIPEGSKQFIVSDESDLNIYIKKMALAPY